MMIKTRKKEHDKQIQLTTTDKTRTIGIKRGKTNDRQNNHFEIIFPLHTKPTSHKYSAQKYQRFMY
jgi:hypothetical protein